MRAAYRATLKAALQEAKQRGDCAMQQRVLLMLELDDKNIPIEKRKPGATPGH